MAFESVRKFKSVVKKGAREYRGSHLSLAMINANNGRNALSIRIQKELVDKMGWDCNTKLDVLVDTDNSLCKLKPNNRGYAIHFPKKEGDDSPVAVYVRFAVPESFDYLPKDLRRTDLTVVDTSDGIIFDMPKLNDIKPATQINEFHDEIESGSLFELFHERCCELRLFLLPDGKYRIINERESDSGGDIYSTFTLEQLESFVHGWTECLMYSDSVSRV